MALNNSVQWLLGLGILVVGGFMLFGRAEEAPSYDETVRAITPEDIPPPPADLPIKLVNAKTKACMADMACMQDFFLKVTLGNEYQPSRSDDPRIKKWDTPIHYRVYGRDQLDQERLDALHEGLVDMTRLASVVNLALGPDRRGINVVVLLTADLERDLEGRFSELADKAFLPIPGFVEGMIGLKAMSSICAAGISTYDDKTIGFVGMYLSPELDHQLLKRCVYEEFSQMLGLIADVTDDIDSLYTDQAHRHRLTEFDFLLLRLLYHPLIEAGMDRDGVTSVFPDVYRDIVREPATLPAGMQYISPENE